jgi:DNA-binding beta-propeller fold protein YncE/cytochrome c peroxidase
LAAHPNGQTLYIGFATTAQVAVYDTHTLTLSQTIPVPGSPLGLALSPDGHTLFVTAAAPHSALTIIDTQQARVTRTLPIGHTAMSPVLSPDGRTLYVCHRFDNEIAFIDLSNPTLSLTHRVSVPREPVAASLTPDGRLLFVANHLPAGRADANVVAASVSVIDTSLARITSDLPLPNGSGLVREIRVSPDGRHAVVVHQLSRFHLPTTQVERGWINTSAVTVIDVARLQVINTVLLDNIDSGAANPWAVAWSADGQTLVITHAGTHELSVIDFPALLAKLQALPATPDLSQPPNYTSASRSTADVPNDLSFLVGLRQRLKLDPAHQGARALALIGSHAWIANYFGDSLTTLDLSLPRPLPRTLPLAPAREPDLARLGEQHFNDASLCFQGWQSCTSCHSADARVDGFNWDLLNDGIGNPKNSKSLLFSHATPPAMSLGVRSDAYVAVRAGIRFSFFTVQPPEVAEAIDVYLESLRPVPSPALVNGLLSPAAERGRTVFLDPDVGCAHCHRGEVYTDLQFHDVGTTGKFDHGATRFDTPTLIELWRTGPYLHDGRSVTLLDMLTTDNPGDRHGVTSHLKPNQIDDLVTFLLSL